MGAQWLRVRARLQVSNDYPGRKMIQFSGNGAQSEINPLIMAGRWEEGKRPILGGDTSLIYWTWSRDKPIHTANDLIQFARNHSTTKLHIFVEH